MNKKTKVLILSLFLIMTKRVQAAERTNINIQIPDFKVTINSVEMEKENNRYPVIVYKDITYFPMTYKNSRFLGVDTFWDNETRTLKVENNEPNGDYYNYMGQSNKKYDTAKVASFHVVVNGKKINNREEKYPLLVYRNVTYFPLTWRFCNDEFDWEYSFDDKSGLKINSKSNTPNKVNINASDYSTNIREYYFSKEIDGTNYLIGENRQTLSIVISKVVDGKDVEIKDTKKNGSNLVLDNDKLFFTVDYETQKIVNRVNLIDMVEEEIVKVYVNKWDPILMTALNGNIYYKTSIENGALFNQDSKKLNKEGALTGLKRVDNYVFATFDKGDNLLVFDKNQNIVVRESGNIDIKTVSISGNVLTYKDENTGKIKNVKF